MFFFFSFFSSVKNLFLEGVQTHWREGGERGRNNERPGTDHVISGPMRGLEKNCTLWHKHINIHHTSVLAAIH